MPLPSLTEQDVRTRHITPAIVDAGWDVHSHLREEVTLTKGRIIVRGKLSSRGRQKRADYVLSFKPGIPLAVIEAKDDSHEVGDGMQQALEYAELLDVPFAFSSNGKGFLMRDATGLGPLERAIPMGAFPSPGELWERYKTFKDIPSENVPLVEQEFHFDGSGKAPRYYQLIAVNRTIEAIARGQNRLLLVMATGTGKTFTAFQIIWRLWKSGRKRRILFLADRNILVDQTRNNDFKPFGEAMTKIVHRQAAKQYEIYLSLYQAICGQEERQNIYKEFSPGFFDLVIVDECHRGSAAEDSAWREILEYFSEATQIGMTATPRETRYVSNITYFGDPVFSYSLRQGIQDGFLAPYKVVRLDLDKDVLGWRPEAGRRDDAGEVIPDRIYNVTDMDRHLILDKRTELVASKVAQFLQGTDRFAKTIVFCEDTEHAGRMRQAIANACPDLAAADRRYVMRITGNDDLGKEELDNFINPEERYPVIATTSRLLSTGVDARTCKLIVLDRVINSMTEFKQIIGRGTRIEEDYGKTYFTIMDFRNATQLFADPDFDGDPVVVYVPPPGGSPVPPDVEGPDPGPEGIPGGEGQTGMGGGAPPGAAGPNGPNGPRRKYRVGDLEVVVLSERVQYLGPDGRLITESLRDYARKAVTGEYASLDAFLRRWDAAERKQVVIDELSERGVMFEELARLAGKELDPFDLVCHVAFDQPPLTRRERAANVRKRHYFAKFGDKARAVLEALLDKYADAGIGEIEDSRVLRLSPLSDMGTPLEIVNSFGGMDEFREAIKEMESFLYNAG